MPIEDNNSFIRSIADGRKLFGADMSLFGDIVDDNQKQYYLTSQHLSDVNSDSELIARVSALKMIFHGMMYIYHPFDYKKISINSAEKFENGKFERRCDVDKVILPPDPFSFSLMNKKFTSRNDLVCGELGIIVFSSRYSVTMREMLMYAGFNGLSYASVYGLLDWIKHEAKERELEWADFFEVSKTKLNDLTATCNEPYLTGVMSRHGGPGNPNTPTGKYVSIHDAIHTVCAGCRKLFAIIMEEIDVEKKITDLLF